MTLSSPLRSLGPYSRHRSMVLVPLLETEPTRHALDLACRLARERGTHVVLIAPLVVDWELPFNAHFRQEEAALGEELARERDLVESYGISARRQIVRARPGEIGRAVADVARDTHASLIVVGATTASTRRSRRPFSQDVWSVLHDAPCPVMIATRRAA
jgi:nucleotide-binding universal stress UspA family protein